MNNSTTLNLEESQGLKGIGLGFKEMRPIRKLINLRPVEQSKIYIHTILNKDAGSFIKTKRISGETNKIHILLKIKTKKRSLLEEGSVF